MYPDRPPFYASLNVRVGLEEEAVEQPKEEVVEQPQEEVVEQPQEEAPEKRPEDQLPTSDAQSELEDNSSSQALSDTSLVGNRRDM